MRTIYLLQKGMRHIQLYAPHICLPAGLYLWIIWKFQADKVAVCPVGSFLKQEYPGGIHLKIEIILRKSRKRIQEHLQAAVQVNSAVWLPASNAGVLFKAPQPERNCIRFVGCDCISFRAAAAAPGKAVDWDEVFRHALTP